MVGLSWLPAYAYPPAQDGYWSPVTSTLNWCEEDYYATVYSAEVINAFTNLVFMYLAFRGVRNCLENGHDTVFLIAFLGYGCTGVGSFAFHSTLKYPMQLWDELAMIYSTCLMNWATFTWKKSDTFKVWFGIGMTSLAVFITLYYHHLQDPTFHQNSYTILTIIVLSRAIWLMETRLRPAVAERQKIQGTSGDRTLQIMWSMVLIGLAIFLAGFAFWALDIKYCSWLRATRHEIGLPWGLLLEGHGWWHLMTGYGAYFYIVWAIWLRHNLNGDQDKFELIWPSMWTSIPDVVRVSEGSKLQKKD